MTTVKIHPAFSVFHPETNRFFYGATAYEALVAAKAELGPLTVVNGRLINAIGWTDPIFSDSPEFVARIVRITDGTLV